MTSTTEAKIVTFVEVHGFDEFLKFVDEIHERGPPVFFYFSGSKNADGNSWCSDCVEAAPVIKEYLTSLQMNIIVACIDVGDREYWKDKKCPFRSHPHCRLMVIPTLLKWQGVQRLEGGQCAKVDLLKLMFEEEEHFT